MRNAIHSAFLARKSWIAIGLSVLVAATALVVACGGTETVVQTVVVEKEVIREVEKEVIKVEVEVEKEVIKGQSPSRRK